VYDRPRMEDVPVTVLVHIVRNRTEGWYRAHIPGIAAYGDGDTEEEAMADLENSLEGYVEAFGLPGDAQ
jgi:predicted RNase H-like HicB family nuclease